jgi:hypothetical protein
MTSTAAPSLDSECFFIAPIGKDGSPERKRSDAILKFVVARAAAELGLTAVRGDQISEPGQITLQVIDHVLRARAAVADLTGSNANVYYELAIRHTAKLPVALIAEKDCVLPFDIAQMRTIFVDHTDLASADSCREAIVLQLSEALSDNATVDSPIATSIDVRALQSGNKVERNVAELVTAVEDLAKVQRLSLGRIEHFEATITDIAMRSLDSPEINAFYEIAETYEALRAVAEKDKENAELRGAVQRVEVLVRHLAAARRPRNRRRTVLGEDLARREELVRRELDRERERELARREDLARREHEELVRREQAAQDAMLTEKLTRGE